MKSIVMEGQLTEAPCEVCRRFVQARFGRGQFELEDGLVVGNVMRATCDTCGAVVSLAQQSSSQLHHALSGNTDEREGQ